MDVPKLEDYDKIRTCHINFSMMNYWRQTTLLFILTNVRVLNFWEIYGIQCISGYMYWYMYSCVYVSDNVSVATMKCLYR